MSSSKDGKVSSFHLFPRCLFQWDGGFSQRIKFHKMMTTQTPGGLGPPCCMNVGSADAVPADFHKKKIGQQSGGPGAKPLASLCVLSPRGERDVAAHWISLFIRTAFYMRGQTPTRPAKTGLACGPPPFFTQRKGEKKHQGEPPGPPENFDF